MSFICKTQLSSAFSDDSGACGRSKRHPYEGEAANHKDKATGSADAQDSQARKRRG